MPLPLAIPLIMGGLQTAQGVMQKIKAAKLAKRNPRPKLKDNKFLNDQYQLTGSYAGTGLTAGAKDLMVTNNDRNQSSALDALLKTGGSANLVGDIYSSGQDALRGLALAEDQARVNNMNRYLGVVGKKSEEERDQFFVNEYAPWKDQAKLISELSTQGMDNIWKGFNTGGSAALQAIDANQYEKMLEGNVLEGGDFSRTPTTRIRPAQASRMTSRTQLPGLQKGNRTTVDNVDINSLMEYYRNLDLSRLPGDVDEQIYGNWE